MKKLWTNAAAALCALATAGPATAAIATGADGNGELFLSVWSQATGKSYTRDLGVRMNDFLPGGQATALGFGRTWGSDAAWVDFVTGLSSAQLAGLRWDVIALDTTVGGGTRERYITTASTNVPDIRNQTLSQFAAVRSHVEAVNLLGETQNPAQAGAGQPYDFVNFGANNSIIARSTDGSAYFGTGTVKGEQWANKAVGPAAFVSTSLIDVPAELYLLSSSSNVPLAFGITEQYENAGGESLFLLSRSGVLTYANAPTPGTLALAVAGLAAAGFVRRRRRT